MNTQPMHVGRPVLVRIVVAVLLTASAALAWAQTPSDAPADQGPDPALANMAPVTPGDRPYSAGDDSYNQPPAPLPDDIIASPPVQGVPDGAPALLTESDQPPPDLPDYEQPDAPEDDDIWNPGYWALGTVGYFWVPGGWTPAPFYGALWTPPYWGFYRGRYIFHPGYWGTHVGFYGGINYGYGYIGTGYFGGYWRGHTFMYNFSVTHVRDGLYNVYEHPVTYRGVHYGVRSANRTSYNGGGGIDARPRPAERAAAREPHMAPTRKQNARMRGSLHSPGTYFSQNHGQPSQSALPKVTGPRPDGSAATTELRRPTAVAAALVRRQPAETLGEAQQAERAVATQRQQRMGQMRSVVVRSEPMQHLPGAPVSTDWSTTTTTTTTGPVSGSSRASTPQPPSPAGALAPYVVPERTFAPAEPVRAEHVEHPGEEMRSVETGRMRTEAVSVVPREPGTVVRGAEPPREPEPKPQPSKAEPQRPAPVRPQPVPVQLHPKGH